MNVVNSIDMIPIQDYYWAPNTDTVQYNDEIDQSGARF